MRLAVCIVSMLVLGASALVRVPDNVEVQSPPRISKQPPTDEQLFQVAQAKVNENDKPFVIECEAEGEPAPTYRWIKNGKNFEWPAYDDRISQQPGRGTLVISRPRDEDLGQYQCFAENEWGIATSNSVFVRKAELNSFKDEPPHRVRENEGSPLKLVCQPPDGWPRPNVYWLIQDFAGGIKSINNSRMTLDPEGNLWFSNVTRNDASDDFYYACAATSVFRNEYKIGNKITLEVISTGASASQNKHPPVRQYVTRKNEVALRGKKVELYCIFGGTPLPQIVWSKNGELIRPSDRITQGNYGKSLIIKHVNFEDKGTYTCEASNGVGTAQSYSINLKVHAVPYFTIEPEFVSAAEDETATITCEASGDPVPEIKWIHNGKPISEAPSNSRRSVTRNSITIARLVKADTGNYGCNATNSLGYVYKDVYVNVLALHPEITQPPMNFSTVDGKTVRITCRVFGAPTPEVKWVRNGQELTGGRYKILNIGDLEIENVIFLDSGTYACYASNKFGEVNASATLDVKEHTRITDKPESYEIVAGNTATFRCNAVTDPSLPLTIDWLIKDQPIDFEMEPRFVRSSDYSLMITKTTELDSGEYTCVARTDLDEVRVHATLTVQDVPNEPQLADVACNTNLSCDAIVKWQPMGDNRSPILHYTIEHNTTFTPDTWEVAKEYIPSTDLEYKVALSPWANYTFRVIAKNKIGPSVPSPHSVKVCNCNKPVVPYKNPGNVMGRGTTPQNLVISWTAMPQIDHNGPQFYYKIYYKRDIPGENFGESVNIYDWRKNNLVVENQPTYQRYKIQVQAANVVGDSNATLNEVTGYSGEDVPMQAPGNFTLNQVKSGTEAELSWSPVPEESVRGKLQGYKIQTWTEKSGEKEMREVEIRGGDKTHAEITNLVPYSKNFVRVLAYNGRYNGPSSETLSFDTPEGTPGTVLSLEAFPMGSSALFLVWTRPAEPNGVLTGYRIYYQVVNGTKLGTFLERKPHIIDSQATSAKLAALAPDTMYRVHIRATTRVGEGNDYFIEQKTRMSQQPDTPQFTWETVPVENGYSNVRIIWLPNLNGNPGSHFFVKYKLKGETISLMSDPEFQSNSIVIPGLQSGEVYVMSVVAVDGNYMSESAPQEVETSSEGPIIQPKENVATAGWFIGMMLAIAILLLVLIIVCVIKRNRGGKYAVHERELAAGRGDYPDEGGFHEYSQPLDTKSAGGRASLASSSHQDGKHPESDTDSMAEYGDGDTEGMNEDGSFIGQYGRHRKQEPNSQAFATLV
ncbi:PREDICTED: neuroglian isoform X2 [Vollenhovia emeryi]|uniref:neuroglian isoform X2 n=1 Tax=Vollenhovia emeryi TaxID=411798 RepID=UPI0005F57B4D|nr:PREDICTED: neuroglian isoform X2 [Vollenhovia emeryi]